MPIGAASFGLLGASGVRLNPDANRANASLLLPLTDGGGGALNVTDYSPLALGMTDGGAASWQTIVQKFYGGAASFPGSGSQQILSPVDTGLQLGSGNWTIEFWYRLGASRIAYSSVLQMGAGTDLYSMLVGYEDGGNLSFFWRVYGPTNRGGEGINPSDGQRITGLVSTKEILLVFKEDRVYAIAA